MHSKIACDHNDHDHYADDVKDIHCFTPIEIPSVSNVLGRYSTIARDCDRGLSKSAHRGRDQARGMSSQFPCLALCRTLYSSPMRRERQVALGVAHLNGFAMICLSLRHGGYAPKLSRVIRGRFGATRYLREWRAQFIFYAIRINRHTTP